MTEGDRARPGIRGSTKTVGIIGWPVTGSLSPVIHNTAFEVLGMDWVYVPLPVPPAGLAEALAGLPALGFAGANVTMPHKTSCADLIEKLSDDARRLRAVNTVVVGTKGLEGHNTDAPGFTRFLVRDAGFEPEGRSALIFGAGGAGRACALALARSGLRTLTIAVRDPGRADGVQATLEGLESEVAAIPLDAARGVVADLVVNATPLGAAGESLPLPRLGPGVVVVDLLYRPAVTPLQAAARKAGASAFGGVGLLLHQAALSFRLWTGRVPPLSAMSAAVVAALSGFAADGS